MKSWIIFIIPLMVIALVSVIYQFQKARLLMVEFARLHGMKYLKPRKNPFGMGEIHAKIGGSSFFMGLMSAHFACSPVAEQDCPDEKRHYMHIEVEGMPLKMVIRKNEPGRLGDIGDILFRKMGVPLLKTKDEAFDTRFDVIGYQEETLHWLTERRRVIIAAFLSVENYVVSKGGLGYCFTKTHVSLDDLEVAFLRLTSARRELGKES